VPALDKSLNFAYTGRSSGSGHVRLGETQVEAGRDIRAVGKDQRRGKGTPMETFLMVAAGLLVVLAARESKKLRKALAKHKSKTRMLPKAVSMFVICAQVSELLKVLDHVTITNVTASLFLLAILAASKSGTESELF